MKAVESIFIFVFLVFFGACLEEDLSTASDQPQIAAKTYPNVDQELWVHFRSFEEAATARGIQVDLARTNIIGTIEEIEEDNIAGTCSYGGRQSHKDVIIDKSFWARASSRYKEYIVFHELGHCYLFRDHKEACLQNRTYASIMRSGNGDCRDNYNVNTREYYLNELFGEVMGP